MFSGRRGGPVTTHYLNSTSPFGGTDSRPSINDSGSIAFEETINFDSGIFVGQEGDFGVVQAPDPDVSVDEPVLNNAGRTAFERSFVEDDLFVTEIVTGAVAGRCAPWWTRGVRSES